mmetsp:Transcript_18493/g.37553  ORF Transcript_18493/g.37553 Transcript_18493/m.37553 type:complete len:249 (-) Transcript_18493:288-1034(-)
MGLPTVASDGTPLLLHVPRPSILMPEANSLILSYGALKRAGYKWRESTSRNVEDSGYLETPGGACIALWFEKDLWHLPVFAQPAHTVRACTLRKPSNTPVSVNTYSALADDDSEPPCYHSYPVIPSAPKPWTQAEIQSDHEAWCHPGTTKTDAIIATYPDRYPKDPRYRAEVCKHRCPVCNLMKGARTYRKSKRMKSKMKLKALRKKKTPDEELLTAIANHSVAPACPTHPDHGGGRRRLHVGVILAP